MIWSAVVKRVASGAFAVAVVCGLLACAGGHPRTDAQRQADQETVARVQAALEADRELYAKHIFVRADNGVVRLSGYVWDSGDLREAQQTAELVEGVTRVINNLELQRNGEDNSGVAR